MGKSDNLMEFQSPQKYSLDTNTWIYLWRYYYPIDVFPSVWDKIDQAIQSGIIRSPREVYLELEAGRDDLFEWLKKRKEVFIELNQSQQQHVIKIMAEFARFVDKDKAISDADPFVIALAIDQNLTVVTTEKRKEIQKGDKEARPNIPNICEHYSVPFINMIPDFLRATGWSF